MKRRIAASILAMLLPAFTYAADDVGSMLDTALDQLVRNGHLGDTSTAVRYLGAILEQQPDHLEARWQLLYLQMVPLKNVRLSRRVPALSALSPEFGRLSKIAKDSKQQAFLHFMTAVHAGFYKAYDRALAEIDLAVALDRQSARYLTAKGRLLVANGSWMQSDAEIENGISVLKEARELLRAQPSPFLRDDNFEFYFAFAISSLTQPRWKEVAVHYQRFVESSEESTMRAFALNNASIAYTRLGECARAQEVAEQALAIMNFGAARSNKRYAEFCLEMGEFGLTTSQ